MRHGKKFNHLSRKSAHRKAMLSNMASSLILHKRIHTTVAKAKALRVYVEPLITKSKDDSTHSRRMVFRYLQNKYAVSELFREIAQKVAERQGGYTRILKTGSRLGDGAEMCFIEFVDYNENMLSASSGKKAKKSRRSRRKKSTNVQDAASEVQKVSKEAKNVDEKLEAKADEKVKETKKAAEKTEESKAKKKTTDKAEKTEAKKETVEKTEEEVKAKKKAPKKDKEVKTDESTDKNTEEDKKEDK